jgi:hypothetical protein
MTTSDNPNLVIDENNVPFLPTAVRFGLIGGLIFIVYSLLANLTGLSIPNNLGKVFLNLALVIAITVGVLVYVIRQHRETELGGYVSFKRAFYLSFVTLFIATVISSLFSMVYVAFIDPGFLDSIVSATEEMMTDMGAPAEVIEAQMAEMEEKMTVMGMLKQGLMNGLIGGVIISLIVAAVMKKKPALDV